jgi:hypothetical protein
MNERIKALAVEADFMLCEDGHFYSEGQSQKITDQLQKFAELIIKDQQRTWVGLSENEMGQFIHYHCQATTTYRSLMDFANNLNNCLIRKNNT